ncbi:MAG TPA: hypothetical protein VHI13_06895 [Candidatus Kapabacteria bacterium]|nr:hypothetical protein [Candidatus Kapabacteria bacterium]
MRMRYVVRAMLSIAIALLLHGAARAQVEISFPAEGAISTLRNQAVTGTAPANLPIRVEVNGVATDSGVVRADGVFEFLGVAMPEGPVRFTVVATMRDGRTFVAARSIHVLGAPDSIALDMPLADLPADGTTAMRITGTVRDRWGVHIPGAYLVTVVADGVSVATADADPAVPGVQVPLDSGRFAFELKSSAQAGTAHVMLEANGIRTIQELRLVTPKQPFMLTGSLSATGSYLETTGPAGEFSNVMSLSDGFNRQGRIAITGRGTILDRYLLTLSVDSDRKLKDRLYRDLDPNVLYGVYGDNSTVTYEAQSASPVYVKMEQDQSYLMYGDFNTGLVDREFAAYNRTLTGGRLHLQNSWAHADLFGTVTNRKVVQEEIRGTGTSGLYYLGNGNIVTGSEKVRIEVRDRLRSDVVISTQDKTRLSDYDIDYTQGTLYFRQPVPSLDDHENPVYIVISSEAITTASDNLVVGGAGEVRLFDRLTLGGTTVLEERSPTNYALLGANGALALGELGGLRGEAARSSDAGTQGYAWKVEADLHPFTKAISLRPYYRHVDGSFSNTNQRGASQELGTTKYGASGEVQLLSDTRISGELYRQKQDLGAAQTDLQSVTGSLRQNLWNGGSLTARVEDVRYNGPGLDSTRPQLSTHSTFVGGRFDATIMKGLAGNVEGEYDVRNVAESVKPNSLGAGIEYDVAPAVTVIAGEKYLEGGGMLTSVGLRTRLGEHTTMDGRYEIGNAIAGNRSALSLGLKNTLPITDELTANILFEKTKDLSRTLVGARTPDHDALSLALEYAPAIPLRASAKGEYSGSGGSARSGITYGVAYRIFDETSLLVKGNYYRDAGASPGTGSMQGVYIFGVAYRPLGASWLNLVAQTELRAEDNQAVAPQVRYRSTIVSMHAVTQPADGLEIGAKYALKSALDGADGVEIRTLTDMVQLRGEYDLTSFLNVAVEGRALRQVELGDLKLSGSAEVGVVVLPNTMLVGGYSFQGYTERDLVDYVYSAKGPYITVRAKFTEGLFGFGGGADGAPPAAPAPDAAPADQSGRAR